jgi:hypothetical protein
MTGGDSIALANQTARTDMARERLHELCSSARAALEGSTITSFQAEEVMLPHALALSMTRQAEGVIALEKAGLAWEAGALVRALLENDFLLGWLLEDDGHRDVYRRTRLWIIDGLTQQLELGDHQGPLSAQRRNELHDYRGWLESEFRADRDSLDEHLARLLEAAARRRDQLREEAQAAEDAERLYETVEAIGRERGGIQKERDANERHPDPENWTRPKVRTLAGPHREHEYDDAYRRGSRQVHPSMHTVAQLAHPIDGGGWQLGAPAPVIARASLADAYLILRRALERIADFESSRDGDSPIARLELDDL